MDEFDEILHDRIESYLHGRMSDEEKGVFELEIAGNESLQETVNLHRLEYEQRELLIRQQLRDQFDNWKKTQPTRRKLPRWLWTLPGMLAVFLGWYYFGRRTTVASGPVPPKRNDSTIPIQSDTLEKRETQDSILKNSRLPSPKTLSGKSVVSVDDTLNQIRLAFLEKDLENLNNLTSERNGKPKSPNDLVTAYKDLTPQDPDYEDTRMILGRAYLHTGNAAKADEVFREMMLKHDPRTQTYKTAEWYNTLILLSDFSTNKEQILSRLKKMKADPDHPLRTSIVRLQSAIDAATGGKK